MKNKPFEAIYPLSPLQEGMLFHSLSEPTSGAYVTQLCCRLGHLDLEAFKEAWNRVIARNPTLRTAFAWQKTDRSMQVVAREVDLPLHYEDWRARGEAEITERLEALLKTERERGFNLSKPPLMRLVLLRTGDEECRFVWSHHHLLLDGWSLSLVLGEVSELYGALRRGEVLAAVPAASSYRDFIAWLEGQDLESSEAYWRRQLAGFETPTSLWVDRGEEAARGEGEHRGEQTLKLSAAATEALQQLSRRHHLTLSSVLQGVWALLLSRYSGRRDVMFGNVVSGRPPELPGVESMVGFFINTLPVRVRIDPAQPVLAYLAELQRRQLELREHEHCPLRWIQRWSEIPSGTLLFDTLFAFENYPTDERARQTLKDLEVSDLRFADYSNYPLSFGSWPESQLPLYLDYDERRYPSETVRRMLEQMRLMLETLVADPDLLVGEMPRLLPEERRQLLVDWNATDADLPELSVPDLVMAQAERTPEATAVRTAEGPLTYGDLKNRSEALALRLRRLGVGPEDRVGLSVDRSAELAVALLGIWKAGAAYLPLDPELPQERLRWLITDGEPRVILTTAAIRACLPVGDERLVDLAELEESEPAGGPELPRISASHLAYVIYTSGSTGAPKGVQITHGSLLNYAQAARDAFGLRASDRILQFSPLSFNVVLEELVPAWLSGASVVLEPGVERFSCADLERLIGREEVTGLELPAAYWQAWVGELEERGARPPACLRFLILGCEKPQPERVAAWQRFGIPLFQVFGLTETTITSTLHCLAPELPATADAVDLPVGRPIANTRLYLLDEAMDPVPLEVAGELYVGGLGVGRGYLHQGGLTAERFVPDLFSAEGGGRLYRTGDQARYRPNGDLEFLGRFDHQLKVRGFRVEPGEIEAALQTHPGVRKAVVAARPNPAGGQRLVGYVVPTEVAREIGWEHGFGKSRKVELWPSQGDYHVYDQALYHAMTSDEVRNRAYRTAMEQLVPGKVVVDVGTGADATLSRMCVAAGARKVYAIEVLDESYRKAQAYVHELGLEDRIEFVYGSSFDVELPEKADVCVSELIGTIGGAEGAVAILNDVWRLMKPGGVMIPWRCATRIAAVRLPDRLEARPAMSERGAYYTEKVFEQMGRKFDLRLCLLNFTEAGLVSSSGHFEDLRFIGPMATSYNSEVELEIEEDTRVDGLLLWVEVYTIGQEVVDVIKYSGCWSPLYFPVFSPAVEMKRGDVLRLECRVSPSAGNLLKPDYEVAGEWLRQEGVVQQVHWASPFRETSLGRNPFYAALFDEEPVAIERENREKLSSEALRAHLEERLPAHMVPADFMTVDELPMTRSGKVDRRALPDPEPRKEGGYVAPGTDEEQALAEIWAEVLGLERVGIEDNFFALGGDSIISLQVVARAQRAGLRISPRQLFEHPTVAGVLAVAESVETRAIDQGPVHGPVPLTPIQCWFFEQEIPTRQHWNMPLLLELRRSLEPRILEVALRNLVVHHDALRLRFRQEGSRWHQFNAGADEAVPFTVVDLRGLHAERRSQVIAAVASQVERALDLAEGPLLRAVYFRTSAGARDRLLLVVHHLVVDGVSWRVLLEDLATAHEQLRQRQAVRLPSKTTSWKTWAEGLVEYARSAAVAEELPYWTRQTAGELARLPRDGEAKNLEGAAETVSAGLTAGETGDLLERVPGAYRTEINDVLLCALERTLTRWCGGRPLLVDLEGHGRYVGSRHKVFEGVDLSRTVGWFTTFYPVHLEPSFAGDPACALKAMKERLRTVPDQGLGHGLLCRLRGEEELAHGKAEVLFNYLGRLDVALPASSPFELDDGEIGPAQDPWSTRSHLLEINAGVRDGRLEAAWSYSPDLHSRGVVEELAQDFVRELRVLIDHCLAPEAGGFTPSDFPLLALDQPALDRLVAAAEQVEDIFPLAPLQEGMIFHSLLQPEIGMYYAQYSFDIEGEVDERLFRQAWEEVVHRHPSLRTSFRWEGLENPVQVVHRRVTLDWRKEDWRDLSETDQEERMAELLLRDRERPPDLAAPPLMRFTLLRLSPSRYRFFWSYFQGLLDGWSLPLVFQDLFAAYRALRRGGRWAGTRPRAYRDYIAWLGQQGLAEAETYWRGLLAEFTEPTPLGVTSERTTEAEASGEEELWLGASLTADLEAWARSRELTLNTLVQGAWALLLNGYSGKPDVVFGATVSGRPPELSGIESMVGVFINTLPVRASISPALPLETWLRELRDQQLESRLYEFSPLVEIQGWSDVPRGAALFDSILVFENYPVAESLSSSDLGFEIRPVETCEQTSSPLTLTVHPGARLRLQIEYERQRFDREAVRRMARHLETLLAGFLADPEPRLGELTLLDAGERQQLLWGFNDTARDWPRDELIHRLFEAQAAHTSEAVAAECGRERLSYGELNRRANRLARVLVEEGVGEDVIVAVLAPRGLEVLTALLAILKAGGCYLPMDPQHPSERHRQVLLESRSSLVLADRKRAPSLSGALADLPAGGQPRVLALENLLESERESTDLPLRGAPASLAYVIFTSGSTGTPKGVMVDHRNKVNHLRANIDALGIVDGDVVAQNAPQSFDVSIWQFLAPLIVGARVRIYDDETIRDATELLRAVDRDRVTVFELVPSLMRVMLEDLESSAPSRPRLAALRWLIPTGETLPPALCHRWFELFPDIPLANAYGPAECSDDVTFEILRTAPPEGAEVPIGHPVANLRAHVLDHGLRPLPVGVPGELWVGGAGVARGYLRFPRLTAASFLPDPWSDEPGARLYRTGDLAFRQSSGSLRFLGRRDHQVKLRGQRIELGEVETALRQLPQVKAAAAAVNGSQHLVAYLVPDADPLSVEELRDELRSRLPEYLVPGLFVVLEELPLSANGKLDRHALPTPDEVTGMSQAPRKEPRTEVETELLAIWCDVLRHDRIGVEDNFFDLGGHSLIATRLISRIRQRFSVELPLRSLFERPTISGLAVTVAQLSAAQVPDEEVARLLAELEGMTIADVASVPA